MQLHTGTGMDNLLEAMRKPFLDVATDIHASIVYLDAGAAEVAQLSLGPGFLLGLGAANICDLEHCHADDALLYSLSSGGAAPTSLVVFTTQLLTETHQHVVHLFMVHPFITRCQLFCSVSELAHAQLDPEVSPLGVEAYREYLLALRQDLATARAAAGLQVPREDVLQLSVRHLPMHVVALDTRTFVLPAAGAVASKAIAGGRAAGFGGTDAPSEGSGHAAEDDGLGASTGLSLLPHALADLSRLLGAKLDPFALGPVSAVIAKELMSLPQYGAGHGPLGDNSLQEALTGLASSAATGPLGAGSSGSDASGASGTAGSIGLVLVDRSLDLATPCMHKDHVLDAVFASLPRAGAAAGPAGAGPGSTQQRVALRPADLRVDVPRLAPMAPLTPPVTPPATPPLTSPGSTSSTGVSSTSASAGLGPANSSQSSSRQGKISGSSSNSAGFAPLCWPMGMSLFHPADHRWLSWLDQLWPKQRKDALLLLRKWLKEALRAEKISLNTRVKLSSVVSPAELLSLAQGLMAAPEVFMRHHPIVGLALAAAAALSTDPLTVAAACSSASTPSCPFWTYWERMSDLERQLLLALPDGSEGAGMLKPMLLDAIQSTEQGRLSLDDAFQLLATAYSLSGDRMPPAPPLYSADEAQIREALGQALLAAATQAVTKQQQQQPSLLRLDCLPRVQQLLHEAVQSGELASNAAGVQQQLSAQLQHVFVRLRWLAACRGKLRDVRRLMQVDVDTGAASNTIPLLRRVLTKILLLADILDLQQPEAGSLVAGLLHRGLGRLGLGSRGGPARSRISDYQTVLLFVVGGISPAEVREIRQELEEHKFGHKPLVLLGGTTLLSPTDATLLLLS